MRDIKSLSALMERVIHKYSQMELKNREYGTGIMLTRAEIHTVVVVVENPGISITELAKKQGITKGAASQMIYKLVDKGMVEKRISPDSDAQISLFVTDSGKVAYEGHESYHRNNDEKFFDLLNSMPEETYINISEVLKLIEEAMDIKLEG